MNIKPDAMQQTAEKACSLLKAIANPHRLVILCQLVEGERSVGEMASFLGIRDSTVSQNLALLRAGGIVDARRDGQTMWYSIKSSEARQMLETLYRLYCSPKPICSPKPSLPRRNHKKRKPS